MFFFPLQGSAQHTTRAATTQLPPTTTTTTVARTLASSRSTAATGASMAVSQVLTAAEFSALVSHLDCMCNPSVLPRRNKLKCLLLLFAGAQATPARSSCQRVMSNSKPSYSCVVLFSGWAVSSFLERQAFRLIDLLQGCISRKRPEYSWEV